MKDYPNLDTKATTANQAMDTILALTEKLQKAEARALAAEMALDRLKTYATDTFIYWDRDQDSKVGKRLLWMSGAGNEGYEPDLEYIHKLDLTAARELLRKAEENGRLHQYLGFLATLSPDFDCAFPVDEHWVKRLYDALRTERDELAALVEDKGNTLKKIQAWLMHSGPLKDDGITHPLFVKANNAVVRSFAITGPTALADLKARVRREVLEEAAKLVEEKAAECRRNSEYADTQNPPVGGTAYRVRASSLDRIAAELRRMAGGGHA